MNVKEKALVLDCPVCGAKPREECHRIDGRKMCEPHSDRRNLVLGVKPRNRREEVNQLAARIVRKATDKP
jgi:hypothetical protein